MSAPKLISEREAVMRERAAVCRAIHTLHRRFGDSFLASLGGGWGGSIEFAERLFPLPKIERPRVVETEIIGARYAMRIALVDGQAVFGCYPSNTLPKIEPTFRVRDAILSGNETIAEHFDWIVSAIADLRANPTELVDDDGSVSSSRPEGRASSEETT